MLRLKDLKNGPPAKKRATSPKVTQTMNNSNPNSEPDANPAWPEKGETLGEGATGTVYRVNYRNKENLPETVALKVFGANNSNALAKYLREVHILDAISDHPNITHYIDKNLALRELILPLASKGSLDDVIKQFKIKGQTIPAFIALKYAHDVACGLAHLHSDAIMIVHNDIKPANVLIFDDTAKITDFDLAEKREGKAHTYQIAKGSPLYMPPEKLLNVRTNDVFKSDIYSFALSCWEMASGLDMFSTIRQRPLLINRVARGGERPELNAIADDYPSTFPRLLSDMWTAISDVRPSASDVKRELKKMQNNTSRLLTNQRETITGKNPKTIESVVHKFQDFSQAVPTRIFNYKFLTNLVLERCGISALPVTLAGLKLLEILNVSENELTHLPDNIGELSKLRSLHCAENQLETVPESIGLCAALTLLILTNNPVKALPPSLHALPLKGFAFINGDEIHQLHVKNQDILEIGVMLMRYIQEQTMEENFEITQDHILLNYPFDDCTQQLPTVFYKNLRKLFVDSKSQAAATERLSECLALPNESFVRQFFV